MSSLSALLIIDAQNDFLAAGGAFTKRHIPPQQLCDAIAWLVQAARQQHRPIVWVTSQYGEATGTPTEVKGKTHLGKPCCVKDSWGSEIVAPLKASFEQRTGHSTDREVHIVKHWYDAFRETTLHQWLQANNITQLSLCGVTTNVCVFHTAQSALAQGYGVEILEEATSASTQGKHVVAVRSLQEQGAKSRHWGELLSEGNPVQLTHVAGESVLHCAHLKSCIDNQTFGTLSNEIEWHRMSHRGGPVPRLIALQGTIEADGTEPLYRHPADEQPPLTAWTPTVNAIRQTVEKRIGHPLNHCLIQLYRHGRDWISEHADKTLDIVRPSLIVNVSIGTTRTMIFRAKGDRQPALQKLPLPHGSMFTMSLDTNNAYSHGIKKLGSQGTNEPRISLTLRYIGTSHNPQTGAAWGIGAPSGTAEEATDRAKQTASLSPEERLEKEKAEAHKLVKLFRKENNSDRFDPASYQPGFEILNFQDLLE